MDKCEKRGIKIIPVGCLAGWHPMKDNEKCIKVKLLNVCIFCGYTKNKSVKHTLG